MMNFKAKLQYQHTKTDAGATLFQPSVGHIGYTFRYNAQNRPTMVEYNGTKYSYIHNLQGDIVGILDSNSTEVVKYMYDAWGKQLSVTGTLAETLGKVQPFRYRGYVYDEETCLYYLRSRFYSTSICRFINNDSIDWLIFSDKNTIAYAMNNPINKCDPDGYDSEDMSCWGGIVDIVTALHVKIGVGFGVRLSGDINVFGIPVNLTAGEKGDIFSLDSGNRQTVVGCEVSKGIDASVKEIVSVGCGVSVFHPYEINDECTCAVFTFEDMIDCPTATVSHGYTGEIGFGMQLYSGIGGNFSGSIDLEQVHWGLIKIVNGISDWIGHLF